VHETSIFTFAKLLASQTSSSVYGARSTIKGGREWSVIPDRCVVRFENRTIPGYATDQAVKDVERLIHELAGKDPDPKAKVKLFLSGEPLNIA
jgi:acetylornithine deacetylase/succinyl-diaminopimelate desuccinylase-like protein